MPRWCGISEFVLAAACFLTPAIGQPLENAKYDGRPDPFYPIDMWLASPNAQRLASGAPGPEYWQQRADYSIDVTLDDSNRTIQGRQKVTYENRSPHPLTYLWFLLDQNMYRPDSESLRSVTAPNLEGRVPFSALRSILTRESFQGGFQIESVKDGDGSDLVHTVIDTVMRVDLPNTLAPGESFELELEFSYRITDSKLIRSRGGYEYFSKDGNYIYEIAQWFPRVAAYTDYGSWRHEQHLGQGEFTLEFGDYDVRITVPEDMIVAASGELQNGDEVLSETQRERLEEAASADKPVFIVTPEEAKENESKRSAKSRVDKKTWVFRAENVRDFAFAASRKFIWDAMGHPTADRTVMAMSFYPNEAEPLWSQYSTAAIRHTLDVYGKFTFDYPYPVAISVNGPIYGMEYPMICFNGPRPEADGTYSKATKYGLISVIIHEVGHNWFPMIVNSDERRWSWMDEGLNTFLQYLAEQEWEEDYPSRRGEPADITGFMLSRNQRPIMTQSDSILQFGNNAYAKPATALNILRETVIGREVFDAAFKEYANRWRFKRPMPEDFFRTIEDASGHTLDWFWRGWFFSTDHVDISIDNLRLFEIDSGDPDEGAERKRRERRKRPPTISEERNEPLTRRVDLEPGLKDFYNTEYDDLEVTEDDRKAYQKFLDSLDPEERKLLRKKTNFYVITFRNLGGLISPIILQVYYDDGTNERMHFPAAIWRRDPRSCDKLLITDKTIQRLELDPQRQTADCDESNNHWPRQVVPSRFRLFKDSRPKNPMQKAAVGAEDRDEGRETEADAEPPKEKRKKSGEKTHRDAGGEAAGEDAAAEAGQAKPKKKPQSDGASR